MMPPHAPCFRPIPPPYWLVAALVVLLAGCAIAPQPTIEPGVDSFSIVIRDNGYVPSRWRVNSNAWVTVEISNAASFDADWVVLAGLPELPYDAAEEADVWFRQQVPAGESVTFTFQVPAMPGEYIVVCSFPGCWERGLMGKLIVALPR